MLQTAITTDNFTSSQQDLMLDNSTSAS